MIEIYFCHLKYFFLYIQINNYLIMICHIDMLTTVYELLLKICEYIDTILIRYSITFLTNIFNYKNYN